jgi:hypothetical protein
MEGFRAFPSAWRTLQGIGKMNMRWLAKTDIAGQAAFVKRFLGLTTA